MSETRWDAIRRRLDEGDCHPSGPVFNLLDKLEREAVEAQAQIEAMTPDWKLGRLVRRMPRFSALVHGTCDEQWTMIHLHWNRQWHYQDIPEAALCEALGEEQE
ncbi:MAG TPA: hypothetical protein VMW24_24975 [Sedimentisphaerales bacterium]|nr:hypothetical protein [Sedimentisphaerales bacterium]